MSWYNNIADNTFIDAIQQNNSAIGDSLVINENNANDETTNLGYNSKITDFIRLKYEDGTFNLYLQNLNDSGKIYFKNIGNENPVEIRDGKLFIYYKYNPIISLVIPSGYTDIIDNIISNRQGINNNTAGLTLLTGTVASIQSEVSSLTVGVSAVAESVAALSQVVEGIEIRVLNLERRTTIEADRPDLDATREAINQADLSIQEIADTTLYNYVNVNNIRSVTNYLGTKAGIIAGITAIITVGGFLAGFIQLTEIILDYLKEKEELKNVNIILKSAESLQNNPDKDTQDKIYIDGLEIDDLTDLGGLNDGEYNIALNDSCNIKIKVLNGFSQITDLQGTKGGYSQNDIIYISKSEIGGLTGNLEIKVNNVYSLVEILDLELYKTSTRFKDIKDRNRRRLEIPNKQSFKDGLEITETNITEESGEITKELNIKLKLDDSQFEYNTDGNLQVKNYTIISDNAGDITTLQNTIGTSQDTKETATIYGNIAKNVYDIDLLENNVIYKNYITDFGANSKFQLTPIYDENNNIINYQLDSTLLGYVSSALGTRSPSDTETAFEKIATNKTDISGIRTDLTTQTERIDDIRLVLGYDDNSILYLLLPKNDIGETPSIEANLAQNKGLLDIGYKTSDLAYNYDDYFDVLFIIPKFNKSIFNTTNDFQENMINDNYVLTTNNFSVITDYNDFTAEISGSISFTLPNTDYLGVSFYANLYNQQVLQSVLSYKNVSIDMKQDLIVINYTANQANFRTILDSTFSNNLAIELSGDLLLGQNYSVHKLTSDDTLINGIYIINDATENISYSSAYDIFTTSLGLSGGYDIYNTSAIQASNDAFLLYFNDDVIIKDLNMDLTRTWTYSGLAQTPYEPYVKINIYIGNTLQEALDKNTQILTNNFTSLGSTQYQSVTSFNIANTNQNVSGRYLYIITEHQPHIRDTYPLKVSFLSINSQYKYNTITYLSQEEVINIPNQESHFVINRDDIAKRLDLYIDGVLTSLYYNLVFFTDDYVLTMGNELALYTFRMLGVNTTNINPTDFANIKLLNDNTRSVNINRLTTVEDLYVKDNLVCKNLEVINDSGNVLSFREEILGGRRRGLISDTTYTLLDEVILPNAPTENAFLYYDVNAANISTRTDVVLDSDLTPYQLKTEAFSGNYEDLNNPPTLFNGDYNSLDNLPTLFDGNYNSLDNLPTLFNNDYNSLDNLPTLFNGDYNSLNNLPTLFNNDYNSLDNLPNLSYGVGDIDGLQTALDGKADTGHTHTTADITDLESKLSLYKLNSAFSQDVSDIIQADLPSYAGDYLSYIQQTNKLQVNLNALLENIDYTIIPDLETAINNAASGGGSSLWTQNDNNIYYNSGNVGIGNLNPYYKAHIKAEANDNTLRGSSLVVEGNTQSSIWALSRNTTGSATLGLMTDYTDFDETTGTGGGIGFRITYLKQPDYNGAVFYIADNPFMSMDQENNRIDINDKDLYMNGYIVEPYDVVKQNLILHFGNKQNDIDYTTKGGTVSLYNNTNTGGGTFSVDEYNDLNLTLEYNNTGFSIKKFNGQTTQNIFYIDENVCYINDLVLSRTATEPPIDYLLDVFGSTLTGTPNRRSDITTDITDTPSVSTIDYVIFENAIQVKEIIFTDEPTFKFKNSTELKAILDIPEWTISPDYIQYSNGDVYITDKKLIVEQLSLGLTMNIFTKNQSGGSGHIGFGNYNSPEQYFVINSYKDYYDQINTKPKDDGTKRSLHIQNTGLTRLSIYDNKIQFFVPIQNGDATLSINYDASIYCGVLNATSININGENLDYNNLITANKLDANTLLVNPSGLLTIAPEVLIWSVNENLSIYYNSNSVIIGADNYTGNYKLYVEGATRVKSLTTTPDFLYDSYTWSYFNINDNQTVYTHYLKNYSTNNAYNLPNNIIHFQTNQTDTGFWYGHDDNGTWQQWLHINNYRLYTDRNLFFGKRSNDPADYVGIVFSDGTTLKTTDNLLTTTKINTNTLEIDENGNLNVIGGGGGNPPDLSDYALLSELNTTNTNVATNANNITANSTAITTLQNDLNTTNTNVANNASQIANNLTNVSAALSQISALSATVNSMTTNISANTNNISGNTNNITTNANNISANSTAITTLQNELNTTNTNVANNASGIANNLSNVTAALSQISFTTSLVNTNTTNIATNTSDITALDSRLTTQENNLNTTNINVGTNATDISTLQSSLSTTNINVANNASGIANNLSNVTAALSQISFTTSLVNTNTTDIATNTSDITALDTRITTQENRTLFPIHPSIGYDETAPNNTIYIRNIGGNGYVGINKTDPLLPLDVAGTIRGNSLTSITGINAANLSMNSSSVDAIMRINGSEPGNAIIKLATPFYGSFAYKSNVALQAIGRSSWGKSDFVIGVSNVNNNSTTYEPLDTYYQRMRIPCDSFTQFYGTYGSGSIGSWYYGYGASGNYINTSWNICTKHNGAIWSTNYIINSSDKDIKKDIEELKDDECLQKILLLKPCKYRYIDETKNITPNKTIGYIAQEVREVLPEAVRYQKEYIPNAMCFVNINNDILTIDSVRPDTFKLVLSVGLKIKLIDESDNDILVEVTEVIDENTFKVNEEIQYEKLFLYGSLKEDFNTLAKEYINAVHVSATQELHRIITRQQQEINELKTKLNSVLTHLGM